MHSDLQSRVAPQPSLMVPHTFPAALHVVGVQTVDRRQMGKRLGRA
jgi:hypothetical protein